MKLGRGGGSIEPVWVSAGLQKRLVLCQAYVLLVGRVIGHGVPEGTERVSGFTVPAAGR